MATQEARIKAVLDLLGDDFKLGTIAHTFYASGPLAVRTGLSKIVMLGSGNIIAVKGYINTAPTGATTFKADVNLNGTSCWDTNQANRPIWTASANQPTVGALDTISFVDGDVLSVDIDAVGSTVAGSDLTLTIYTLRTS